MNVQPSVKAATTHSTDGAGCYRLSQPGVGLAIDVAYDENSKRTDGKLSLFEISVSRNNFSSV